MRIFGLLGAIAVAATLSACSMFPVGPDLAKAPSPFGDAATVHILDDKGETLADIAHQAPGDRGVMTFGDFDSKTYKADVTWHEFDSGLKDDNDYWLAGINLFQTADRSAYAVLRFPRGADHDLPFKADMMVINCTMRTDGDDDQDDTSAVADDSSSASSSDSSSSPAVDDAVEAKAKEMADQLTGCDFDTLDQVYAFLPGMLTKAAQEAKDNEGKSEDDKSSDYEWEKVTVKIP